MYYSELMQKFWHFNEKVEIGTTAIAMYLYLLKLANDTNDYAITISDVAISKTLGITRKTVKTTKQKLKRLGVIEYGTRSGIPSSYRIIVDYPFWEIDTESFEQKEEGNKSIEEKEQQELKRTQKKQEQEEQGQEQMLKPHIQTQKDKGGKILRDYYKKQNLQTNKRNLITLPKEPLQETAALTTRRDHPPEIPSLEEFLEYAQTLEAFLPPLHTELIKKYHFWKDNGWKSNSNRPITNWKLSLKQILPYMKDKANQEIEPTPLIPNIQIPEELERRSTK